MALRSSRIRKGTNQRGHASSEVQPYCLQILCVVLSSMAFPGALRHLRKCSCWQEFLLNLISARSPTASHPLNMSRVRGQDAFFLANSLSVTDRLHAWYLSPKMQKYLWGWITPSSLLRKGGPAQNSLLSGEVVLSISLTESFSLPALTYNCCRLLFSLLLLTPVRFCVARSTCIQDPCVHLHWRSVRIHSFFHLTHSRWPEVNQILSHECLDMI